MNIFVTTTSIGPHSYIAHRGQSVEPDIIWYTRADQMSESEIVVAKMQGYFWISLGDIGDHASNRNSVGQTPPLSLVCDISFRTNFVWSCLIGAIPITLDVLMAYNCDSSYYDRALFDITFYPDAEAKLARLAPVLREFFEINNITCLIPYDVATQMIMDAGIPCKKTDKAVVRW